MLSEYDRRQLFPLAKQVEGFEEGPLTLREFVDRSWGLLAAVECTTEGFRKEYRSLVGRLEVIVALAGEGEQPEPDWRHSDDVRPTVQEMKRLFAEVQTNGPI